jgi:hypothetical protein
VREKCLVNLQVISRHWDAQVKQIPFREITSEITLTTTLATVAAILVVLLARIDPVINLRTRVTVVAVVSK